MDNFENNRVLIVDDNKDIHNAYRMILNPEQNDSNNISDLASDLFDSENLNGKSSKMALSSLYEVSYALSGEDAIELVQQSVVEQKPFAVLYMDVRMPPGIDGIQALKQIWIIDPNVEAVICSAHSDYSWEETLDELGDSDKFLYLKKPFEVVEVQQMTLSLIKKWNKMAKYEKG